MSIVSLHNCGQCEQRLVFDINFGEVTRWVCQGCGIQDGVLKPLTDEELTQLVQQLQPQLRRIIVCHGSLDPPINDPNWLNAETLDNDPSKKPTYTVSISDQWPQDNPLWGQFDEVILKSCNNYALFNNIPESPILRADPLNPTEEEMNDETNWWESLEGRLDLVATPMAWYNIGRLLKPGGKLYFNHINLTYIELNPLGDDADLCMAINKVFKDNQIPMYFVDEFESVQFNDDEFHTWTLYHGTPPWNNRIFVI